MPCSNLDRDVILENKEQVLIWIFSASKPSDLTCREDLLSTVRQFLKRGTPQDLNAILPEANSWAPAGRITEPIPQQPHSLASTLPSPPGPPVDSPCQGTNSNNTTPIQSTYQAPSHANSLVWTTPVSSSGQIPLSVSSSPSPPLPSHQEDFARIFFQSRVKPAQASFVLRALHAILASSVSVNPKLDCPISIWSGTGSIFAGDSSVHPIKRCKQGREKINSLSVGSQILKHVSHLFFSYNVDEFEQWYQDPLPLYLSRKTLAFSRIAKISGDNIEKVRTEYKRCSKYKYLFQNSCPGIFLFLGSEVDNLWRQDLNQASIDALLEFLQYHCQVVYERACKFNTHASQLIYDGLIAYGWTKSLFSMKNWLVGGLQSFIPLDVSDSYAIISKGDHNLEEQMDISIRSSGYKRQKTGNPSHHSLCQRLPDTDVSSPSATQGSESCLTATTTPMSDTNTNTTFLDTQGYAEDIHVGVPVLEQGVGESISTSTVNLPTVAAYFPQGSTSLVSAAEDGPQECLENLQNDAGSVVQLSNEALAAETSYVCSFREFDLFSSTRDGSGIVHSWNLGVWNHGGGPCGEQISNPPMGVNTTTSDISRESQSFNLFDMNQNDYIYWGYPNTSS